MSLGRTGDAIIAGSVEYDGITYTNLAVRFSGSNGSLVKVIVTDGKCYLFNVAGTYVNAIYPGDELAAAVAALIDGKEGSSPYNVESLSKDDIIGKVDL